MIRYVCETLRVRLRVDRAAGYGRVPLIPERLGPAYTVLGWQVQIATMRIFASDYKGM